MGARPLRLLFAGGGTGGHLYPALAIADQLRRRHPDAVIDFVGTEGKIESRIVPARGYPFSTIWISGFRRRISLETALFPLKVVVALLQSAALVVRKNPDVVIGTGGYVCGPVVAAAQILGRRTLLQEQNSVPGATTRMLAPRADEVHIAFERAGGYLKRHDNVRLTGNPVRESIGTVTRSDGARFFGLDPRKTTLLVFGGSRGASTINAAVALLAGDLAGGGMQIIWQTGEEGMQTLRGSFGDSAERIKLLPFIEKMEYAYAAADLAVCRSGASSLAELTRAGVPAILIPYPHAAADHQTENAKAMVDAGAALRIADAEAAALLPAALGGLIHDAERLKSMGNAARLLGRPGLGGRPGGRGRTARRDGMKPMEHDKTFKYKLDFYYLQALIYLVTLVLYGGIRGNFIEREFHYVLNDPIMYVIVFFVLMSFITLGLNYIRNRRLIITDDAFVFKHRWQERRIPFAEIEWMHIGREPGVQTGGRFQVIVFKLKERRRVFRIRVGRYERERDLVAEMARIASHVPKRKQSRWRTARLTYR